MEIITIEARTFEAMMVGFETLAKEMEVICQQNGDKGMQKWLDNQEVCELLKISKRTVQTYREKGLLPFSQIGHKMYYRPQDVEEVFKNLKTESNE